MTEGIGPSGTGGVVNEVILTGDPGRCAACGDEAARALLEKRPPEWRKARDGAGYSGKCGRMQAAVFRTYSRAASSAAAASPARTARVIRR